MSDYFENNIRIPAKYSSNLDILSFSQMMKDPSFCYKFYWLEAIVNLISEGKNETTFNDVINEMIINAWYPVREYHIHLSGFQLGEIRDGLERSVNLLASLSDLPSTATRIELRNAIAEYDLDLKVYKEQLTNMVPYRALSGFSDNTGVTISWGNTRQSISQFQLINDTMTPLPYVFGSSPKLKREIYFNSSWAEMINENMVQILGWIQHEKLKWLQSNNPEVPGIVYKLNPADKLVRKMNNVKKLWNALIDVIPVYDVFTQKKIQERNYDIDHFVPFSFVMNDELWNLMPMDSSLNSSKSNRLPKWEPYFDSFATNQFAMYEATQKSETLNYLFSRCYKDNIHSIWAAQELYRPNNSKEEFISILSKNMQSIYDSAKRQGYEVWNY